MPSLTATPRHARERTRPTRLLVALVAALSAVAAALSGAHPTGTRWSDAVWLAALGALVPFAASRAHRWSWYPLAGLAVVASSGLALVLGLGAVVCCVAAAFRRRRSRLLGAAAGALGLQALLRSGDQFFFGATVLVGAAAIIPVLVSGYHAANRTERRIALRSSVAVLMLMGLMGVAYLAATAIARTEVDEGVARSRSALDAARDGDSARAQDELDEAVKAFSRADRLLNAPWLAPARGVPLVGQHAVALGTVTGDGGRLARAARQTVIDVDYDRLRYRSGRFDLRRIEAARKPLAEAAAASARADAHVAALDRSWLVPPLRDRLASYANQLRGARDDTALAAQVAAVAPGMLGADGPRTYFVAFVTPAELRGSGGFMGNFGILTADAGQLRLTRSDRTQSLLDAAPPGTRSITGPADYLARFGRFDPADHFQDVFYAADFPTDAKVVEELYPQSGGTTVDGVLSVDPYGLAALLELTGPVSVPGLAEPLSSDNAARLLLRDQYRVEGPEAARADLLEAASKLTFEKLTTGDLPEPRELVRVLGPLARQGRFKLHTVRAPEQRLLHRVGLDWAVARPDGQDFLAITAQNTGNNKIDAYLHRSVRYQATVDPDGTVDATITLSFRNDAPPFGLPAAVIGNTRGLPAGTNLFLLSVLTPHRLEGATVNGLPTAMESQREAGYHTYGRFLSIPPGGTTTVVLEVKGEVEDPAAYRLTLHPQPTVTADTIDVAVSTSGAERRKLASSKGLELDERRVLGATAP